MLPLLYTNVVYMLLFVLVFGVWSGSEFLGPVRWSGLREGKKQDQGSILTGAVAGIAGLVLAFLLPVLLPAARIPWQAVAFFAGTALVFVGMCWRWYAIRTLGRYFTATVMIQDGQTVVQHGPYTLIRHPSYSGVLIIMMGFGLMIGNWLSVVTITGGLLVGLLHRISVEEQELLLHLGQPYKEYMLRTKRLIPFVF